MTDRLTTLLHDEGSGIEVPRPEPQAVIACGRRLRRRRRTTAAVAGAVAAVLVVGAALTAVVLISCSSPRGNCRGAAWLGLTGFVTLDPEGC